MSSKRQQQPKPPSIPKVARGFAAKPRNSERNGIPGQQSPPQPRPSFSHTIRGRSRSRVCGLTFADTPQDERTPAARSAQRRFFHVRGRAGKEGRPRAGQLRQLTRRCKPSCACPRQHRTGCPSGSRGASSSRGQSRCSQPGRSRSRRRRKPCCRSRQPGR